MFYQAPTFGSITQYKTPVAGLFYSARALYNSFLLYKIIAVGSEIRKQVKLES